ncbi:GntR family transcriptional regulator [Nonomuraea deserti]|uniref:GntR family transcriptional regulator n=1 Tax=Nonomuraea deserti TaxID=1848322 RepID=A0A4R4VAR8_9ACTN|nr:TetR/AcrR family transcriptional regulator C-terminal domain-containing protein [Nonomuraea deserti]TDC99004.1 GntR family transcriptional regulator [Nonomuraea deserti]
MTTPPYARIVADIKRRVADGKLRPGERVPSTRQLARDWGVALATASKALALLAREGVVVAEPRVGTVVAEPRGRARAEPRDGRPSGRSGRAERPALPGHDVTRERIVRAAIEIADTDGLSELTMRAVAGRLGMATMSLYRHVSGKDDLLTLMIDAAVGEFPLPEEAPAGWRARLETSARLQWAAFRKHPWMARTSPLTRPLPSPALFSHTEWALAALGDGLDATSRMYVIVLMHSYVQGIAANLDMELQARADTGMTDAEWMSGQESRVLAIAESGRYPAFLGTLAEMGGDFDLRLDRLFEFGLARLLDGLAVEIG